MQYCTHCETVAPNGVIFCPKCHRKFQNTRKKQRWFLIGLFALLIYDPAKSWEDNKKRVLIGAISVAVVIYIILGPVLKSVPPFLPVHPAITVVGKVVPGALMTIHGTNFPALSNPRFTLDGIGVTDKTVGDIIADDNGSFDASLNTPADWQLNSRHVIVVQVIGQDKQVQARVQQSVVATTLFAPTAMHFAFSGSISGPLVVTAVSGCGRVYRNYGPIQNMYSIDAVGSVAGIVYKVSIEVPASGGQYSVGLQSSRSSVEVDRIDGSEKWISIYQTTVNLYKRDGTPAGTMIQWNNMGTITLNSDEKSGSISVSLRSGPNADRSAQITGDWACV